MAAETIFNDVNFKFTLLKLKLTNLIFITYLLKSKLHYMQVG